MNNFIVSFNQVDFAYGEKPILSKIDLQIAKGKITAIMGGSGCGKTTLLKLISGQISATSGIVNVFDQNIETSNYHKLYQLRKKMGMLFQFGALFTDMTVAQNIAFPLIEHTNLPKRFIDRIVAMKLESVGLNGTQDLMPNDLSGGMARRIALARAMAMDPQLMLYDEPFTGLDPISLNVIAMLIKKLNDHLGQTSILVTHDIGATMQIADYVYFVSDGKIIFHGTKSQIQSTDNPAVKQFIDGAINGPFAYKYQTSNDYKSYLGLL